MHCFLGGFRSCAECETGAESIDLPDKIGRNRAYKLHHDGGLIENYCTSDFFHTDADMRRKEAWKIMKQGRT